MSNYSGFKNGSIWRRWDLHIHTPGTLKNDQFTGSSLEEKWSNYINDINNYPDDISVVGVTDYTSIDNYLRFKQHVKNGEIVKSFDLIIPNIELRIYPVTGTSTAINIHCLFNPEIDDSINSRFLSKLQFVSETSSYSAGRSELIRLGKDHSNNQSLDDEAALRVGISQFVIPIDALKSIFKGDPNLKENTIIIVSNRSSDGASGLRHSDFFIDGTSQLEATRQAIYKFCDGIFSANPSDIDYFVGRGPDSADEVIRKCGTLMPCVHGCDAHSNDRIFNPDENRYCWIKADPTFEGLRQTKYEPEARVKIQSIRPEIKNNRYVITKVKFTGDNELFGDQEIHLNDNLNAIIGGKSSGKSLLLYSIADSIDPAQVKRASERLKFEGYNFDNNYDFEVEWKDAEKDILSDRNLDNKVRKITFIPQLFINHLAERKNKNEINDLIKSILLQNAAFKDFYNEKTGSLQNLNAEINRQIEILSDLKEKGTKLSAEQKEIGTIQAIDESIKRIEQSIQEGKKLSNFSEEEATEYDSLAKKKHEAEEKARILKDEFQLVKRIIAEFESKSRELFGVRNDQGVSTEKGSIDRLIDEADYTSTIAELFKKIIANGFEAIKEDLNQELTKQDFDKQIKDNQSSLNKTLKKLEPYNNKLKSQKDVTKLTESLDKEKAKLGKATGMDRQMKTYVEDYKSTKNKIAELLQDRIDLYTSIVDQVNSTHNEIGDDIMLEASLEYRKEDFDFFYHVDKRIPDEHSFHDFFNEEIVNYALIPTFFKQIKKIEPESLLLDDNSIIRLNSKVDFEDILDGFSKDAYHLDYKVTYKNDELLTMSPGKKGTVLLILFLQISSNEYPILIDQPEDNLDNRTIYELLCRIIREKKKHRQIIIVSHNANLVVSTDAENIIVANQEGQDPNRRKSEFQFEYVNGSLEYTFPMDNQVEGILFQQGIKEHVCDILEGGNEAFRQRERKYRLS